MIELLDALADARDVWRRVERAAAELARQHGHLEDVWAGRLTVNRSQLRLDLPLCQSCEAAA